MAQEPNETRLSEADLDAFASKLDQWADSLPLEEQGLLQFLLARAEAGRGRGPGSADDDVTTDSSPGELAASMLRPVVDRGSIKLGAARQCNWSTWSRGVPP